MLADPTTVKKAAKKATPATAPIRKTTVSDKPAAARKSATAEEAAAAEKPAAIQTRTAIGKPGLNGKAAASNRASAKATFSKKTAAATAKAGTKSTPKRPVAKQFRFGYLVHDVSRVRRTLMDEYMRPLGITRSQWSVLSTLSRVGNDGMMQVDLARLLDVGKVTVGGLVDRLEATGHVERKAHETDRRVKRVFITEQGFAMLREMIAVAQGLNTKILNGVTPEELEITEKVLMRVKDNIRNVIDVQGVKGANSK